jgi:hypothetical protein
LGVANPRASNSKAEAVSRIDQRTKQDLITPRRPIMSGSKLRLKKSRDKVILLHVVVVYNLEHAYMYGWQQGQSHTRVLFGQEQNSRIVMHLCHHVTLSKKHEIFPPPTESVFIAVTYRAAESNLRLGRDTDYNFAAKAINAGSTQTAKLFFTSNIFNILIIK